MRGGAPVARPWEALALPAGTLEPESMLSVAERRLLYWLGAEHARGDGAIVDAGCFVGGSTVALAEGVRANSHVTGARIDAFDRFVVDEFMAEHYLARYGLRPGESFRHVFDANTAAVRDLLVVHEGDFAAAEWEEHPIEVLFVDIAKTWELNDIVTRRFFPWLVPERSIVVQQDLAHAFCPWLAVTMELLAEHFELIGWVEQNSVVYRCRRAVPADAIPPRLQALPGDRRLALLDRAITRFAGVPAALLACARVVLLAELGDLCEARAQLSAIQGAHAGNPVVAWETGEVEAALAP
jgi:hypothetical protein